MDLATIDKLLTTTRSVRRRLDLTRPVDLAVIEECLELVVQAPAGGNVFRDHFMIVTDAKIRATLADRYRQEFNVFYPPDRLEARRQTEPRDVPSWTALADHFQDVPTLIFPCVEGRPEGLLPERLAGLYGNIFRWRGPLCLRCAPEEWARPGPRSSSSTKLRSRHFSGSRELYAGRLSSGRVLHWRRL